MNPQLTLIKQNQGTSGARFILHSVFEAPHSAYRPAGFSVTTQPSADGYNEIRLKLAVDTNALWYEYTYPVVHSVPLDMDGSTGGLTAQYRVSVVDDQGNGLGSAILQFTGGEGNDPPVIDDGSRPIGFDVAPFK